MKYKKLYLSFILISLILSMIMTSCENNSGKTPEASPTLSSVSEITEENSTESATLPAAIPVEQAAQKSEMLSYIAEIEKHSIISIGIKADETQWQDMLANAAKEEYISADITINGETITNAGIRPKGNSSLSSIANSSTENRYSFKIEFDHYVKDQTWKGLDKLVINNMYSDTSYMKEYLSYDIMEYIGVDAPLYAFADIDVNGDKWGFYLAIECYEDSYVERVFDGKGDLYKPESGGLAGGGGVAIANIVNFDEADADSLPDIVMGNPAFSQPQFGANAVPPVNETSAGALPQSAENAQRQPGNRGFNMDGGRMSSGGIDLKYTDNKTESYSAIFDNSVFKCNVADYERVIKALKNLSEGRELEKYIDVDAVLRYFAAHTAVVSLDSYVSSMGHNYYIYENDGQISILPWDYNMAFGGFQSGSASDTVNFPIDTPVSGVSLEDRPLIGKLLEVPEYLERYHSYIAEILNGYFSNGKFEQKVDEINARITDYVKNDPTAFITPEQYDKAIEALKTFGKLRAASMQGQLDGTVPSTTESQKAEKEKLIDASSLNMSDLGSMGGIMEFRIDGEGGERNFHGNMPNMPEGLDSDKMFEAMEIIGSAENGVLTDEQRKKLYDMGFTDEQITQFMQIPLTIMR